MVRLKAGCRISAPSRGIRSRSNGTRVLLDESAVLSGKAVFSAISPRTGRWYAEIEGAAELGLCCAARESFGESCSLMIMATGMRKRIDPGTHMIAPAMA
jgi:hypothetical protein